MPRIIGSDSDIIRKMFAEATQAMGCTAIYHELRTSTSDLYNDPTTSYYPPICLEVLFEDNPKVKVLKNLGWYNEDDEIRPLLIYLPIYKPSELESREILNIMENSLVEIVYFGVPKRAVFRISAKRLDSLYGNYWVCKCVPERKISFTYDPIDGYGFLDVNRVITSSDVVVNVDTSASSLLSRDSAKAEVSAVTSSTLTQQDTTVVVSSVSTSNALSQQDLSVVDETTQETMLGTDFAQMDSFFNSEAEIPAVDSAQVDLLSSSDAEIPANDSAQADSLSNAEIPASDSAQAEVVISNVEVEAMVEELLSGDDYSSLVMEG